MIISLLSPKPEVKIDINKGEQDKKETEALLDYLGIFGDSEDFDIKDNRLYFKGIHSIAIPNAITAHFVSLAITLSNEPDNQRQERLVEIYNGLKMFTLKLLCNPLESSRDQLMTFVTNNDVKITNNGNLVLYRRANNIGGDNELVQAISTQYLKIKAWKKSPKNYWLTNYTTVHTSAIQGNLGNLQELYDNLPNLKENKFVAQHQGAMEFKIGDVYKIEESEVDLNAGVCHAGGLHCCSYDYDYEGYGDTPLVVLVNPTKTITVPTYEIKKMRVSEMYVVGIHENVGNHISDELIHSFDENYHNYSLEELEDALKNRSVANVSVAEAVSELPIKEIVNIKDLLSKRIILI